MATIYLNGNAVEPVHQVEGGTQYSFDASKSNYILIHCTTHILIHQYEELQRLHVQVGEYLGDNVYLCRYEPADLEAIRALPYVIYANVYHQDLVITNELKEKRRSASDRAAQKSATEGAAAPTGTIPVSASSRESISQAEPTARTPQTTSAPSEVSPGDQSELGKECDVYLVLHPGSRPPNEVRISLADELGIDPSRIVEDGNALHMKIRLDKLEKAAGLDEIRTIQEVGEIRACAQVARKALQFVEPSIFNYWRPGGIDPNVYDAAGEIVAVTDTGFDLGSTDDAIIHPAFKGRVLALRPITTRLDAGGNPVTTPPSALVNDINGHGTHVAGCVLANGYSTQFGPIRGTAPKANLVFQSIGQGVNQHGAVLAPQDRNGLLNLYDWPYINHNARIHSNSWGSGQQAYNYQAKTIDNIVRQRRGYLILFAAGNHAPDPPPPPPPPAPPWPPSSSMIGAEPAAKNILTVGACETSRPLVREIDDNSIREVYRYMAGSPPGNPDNICWFSNPGPTCDGANARNKPDVVAPGCGILSARSQVPNLWWLGNPPGYDFYGESTDTKWIFSVGTSMATPLVAGSCAVLRKYIRSRRIAPPDNYPSAALLKVLIINGTTDLQGAPLRGPSPLLRGPDIRQGFGRVNIAASLRNVSDTVNGSFHDEDEPALHQPATPTSPDDAQNSRIFPVTIEDRMDPYIPTRRLPTKLTVTMAYTDPAGAALINSLYLSVSMAAAPAAMRYANNPGTEPDLRNNVQKLIWDDIPGGVANVRVRCTRVTPPTDTQNFAIAWYVDYGPPSQGQNIFSRWELVVPSAIAIALTVAYLRRRGTQTLQASRTEAEVEPEVEDKDSAEAAKKSVKSELPK